MGIFVLIRYLSNHTLFFPFPLPRLGHRRSQFSTASSLRHLALAHTQSGGSSSTPTGYNHWLAPTSERRPQQLRKTVSQFWFSIAAGLGGEQLVIATAQVPRLHYTPVGSRVWVRSGLRNTTNRQSPTSKPPQTAEFCSLPSVVSTKDHLHSHSIGPTGLSIDLQLYPIKGFPTLGSPLALFLFSR